MISAHLLLPGLVAALLILGILPNRPILQAPDRLAPPPTVESIAEVVVTTSVVVPATKVATTGRIEIVSRESNPTPTPDRLAPPPTVTSPTQADEGAYLYWLNCQPCHGDRGQGLTDEWRMEYPEEDRNCWNAGCHGERPYENGFKLPEKVPALIGEDSLAAYETFGQVHAFMRAAMPFQAPGSLKEEEYLAITAFLAREHGVWNAAQPLDEARLRNVPVRPAPDDWTAVVAGAAGLLAAGVVGAWLWRRRSSP